MGSYRVYQLLIPLFFFLLNCSAKNKEKEPDNNFRKTSQELFHKKPIKGTYYSSQKRDFDYYFVRFSQPKMIAGSLTGVKGVDARILLFRKGFSKPAKIIDDTGSSSSETFGPIWFDKPGVIIRIEPKRAHKNKDYKELFYTFTPKVYSVSHPSEKESNDSFSEANPIENVITGYYSNAFSFSSDKKPVLEKDFFKLELKENKKYRLNLILSKVSGIDPVLYLYGSDQKEIRIIDNRAIGQGEILPSYGVFGPNLLYIAVAAKDRKINQSEYYEINISSEEFQDKYEFEPNESFKTATPLVNKLTEGEIGNAKDIDFYQYTNPSSETAPINLRLELIPSSNFDPEIFVYNSRKIKTLYLNDGKSEEIEGISNYLVNPGETVYFRVTAKEQIAEMYPLSYEVQFDTNSPADGFEIEPNNSPKMANSILVNANSYGYLNPNNDKDYLRISSKDTRPVNHKITLSGIDNCKVQLSIADRRGIIVRTESANRWGEGISITERITNNQLFILQCRESRNNLYRNSYELRVQKIPQQPI